MSATTAPSEEPAGETLSFGEFLHRPHFSGLDFLRGVSILLVLFYHTYRLPPDSLFDVFQTNARNGVALFFMISGFLIANLLLRERRQCGAIHIGHFYLRRALRLLPLYYLVLVLHVILGRGLGMFSPENQQLFDDKFWAYFFYFSNWLPTAGEGPFFHSWSLAAEEQFYVVFGLGIVLLSTRSLVAGIGVLLLGKVALLAAYPELESLSPVARAVLSYQEPILYGVLLAYALNTPRGYAIVRSVVGPPAITLLWAAATAAFMFLHLPERQSGFDAQVLYLLFAVVVGGTVIRRGGNHRLLVPIAKIGVVSYGIYLLHMLPVSATRRFEALQNTYSCFLATLIIVLPLAFALHRWFEAPIIRYYKARFGPEARAQAALVSRSVASLAKAPVVFRT